MVIDHTLGTTRGAGGIVQCKAFPFVLRHDPVKGWVGAGQQILVGRMATGGGTIRVGNFDDLRRGALHRGACIFGQGHKLAVDQHHLGPAVIKNIGHRGDIQPHVDGIQHRTTGGHAKMRLGLGWGVGQKGCDHLAGGNAHGSKGGGKAGAAVMVLRIGHAVIAVDDSGAGGKDTGGAAQVRKRGQRHIIGGAFVQTGFVVHPPHVASPPKASSCDRMSIAAGPRF